MMEAQEPKYVIYEVRGIVVYVPFVNNSFNS